MMHEKLAQYLYTLGFDEPEKAVEGWTITPAYRADVECGLVLTKGTEVHIVAFDARRAMTRKNILAHMSPLIEQYGYCTTRVPIDEKDHKLREHLGFTCHWQDELFTYWIATELPYQKKVTS